MDLFAVICFITPTEAEWTPAPATLLCYYSNLLVSLMGNTFGYTQVEQ